MPEDRDEKLLSGLQEELQKRPELAETINLHQELIAARREVEPEVTHIRPDQREVDELLARRTALLRRWNLKWDEQSFIGLAAQVCDIGARHRKDLASQFAKVRSLLVDDPVQTRSIVTAYLAENKVEVNQLPEIDHELLSFVLNNALHPFLHAYAAVLTPLIEDEKWYQRLCPVCGGEPDFGYLEGSVGGLRLLCSRCDTVWMYKRGECTFCGNTDRDTFAYYLGDDEVYRLYVCGKCSRYLKVIDGRQTGSEPMLPLQRILTVGMDISARQEGYH